MDSLLTQQIFELSSQQDTLFTLTSEIKSSVDNIKEEKIIIKLLPFLGVIVGAIITYVGQAILKKRDIKLSTTKFISEHISNIFTQVNTISFNLKELAYLEVDSKYQYYLANTDEGEGQKRALEEHYNDYKYIADTKSKIVNAIAEIDASVNSYYRLKNESVPPNFIIILNAFSNHILNIKRFVGFEIPSEEEYKRGEKHVTTEMIEKSIQDLFEEYNSMTINIRHLATEL